MSSTTEAQRGLYAKYLPITRADGQSAPGEKHDGCEYFVLDITHDPHALPALHAYALSCESDYPALAADLRTAAGNAPEVARLHPTLVEIRKEMLSGGARISIVQTFGYGLAVQVMKGSRKIGPLLLPGQGKTLASLMALLGEVLASEADD